MTNVKRQALILACSLVAAMSVCAQVPLRYERAPLAYEQIFLDRVRDFGCRIIDASSGQFLGQCNKKYLLYGYGQFLNNSGEQIFGKFRNGELIEGISLGASNVIVGNKRHYCSYSLTSGRLEFIMIDGVRQELDYDTFKDYSFMSQSFANGDRYVGEIFKGERQGFGVYYYAKGGFWYGEFKGNVRNGYGALFKADNTMVVGRWVDDQAETQFRIKQDKRHKSSR